MAFFIKIWRNFKWRGAFSFLACSLFVLSAHASLVGQYTINQKAAASATNYTSFASLANDLSYGIRKDSFAPNGPGISGAVIITIVQGSGPYFEQVQLDSFGGASVSNTLTFKGNNEMLLYNTAGSALHVFRINGADFITIDSLVIQASGATYGRCVEIRNESNFIEFNHCIFEMPNMTGTSDYNGYVMVTNGTSKPSVFTNPGMHVVLKNNIMHALTNGGPYYGVWLSNVPYGTTSTGYILENNDISDVYYSFIQCWYTVETSIKNNQLHNNKHNRSGYLYGIYLYNYLTRCDAEIHSNFLYEFNNSSTGSYDGRYPIYVYMYGAPNSRNLSIVNNILDIRCTYYTPGIYVYAYTAVNNKVDLLYNTLYFGGAIKNSYSFGNYMAQMYYTDLDCRNNIFYCDWEISGPLYALYYVPGSIKFDNNLAFLSKTSGSGTAYYGFNGSSFATLTDWSIAISGKNNLQTDPLFLSPDNYKWQPNSFQICNKGTPTSVNSDIYNNKRDLIKPDIGAIEYNQNIAIKEVVVPNTITCSNESQPIKVLIKNLGSTGLRLVPLAFSVNGTLQQSEMFNTSLLPGDSVYLTFSVDATFNNGTNSWIQVFLDGADDDSKDNIKSIFIEVHPGPNGASLKQHALFNGYFKSGSEADPDATIAFNKLYYEIENPIGYDNSKYDTTWKLIPFGKTHSGFYFTKGITFTPPSSGKNGIIEFDPDITWEDSLVYLGLRVLDTKNNCDSLFGRFIYVAPSPNVNFEAVDKCDGEIIEFKNKTTLSKGQLDYFWDFGDTFTQNDTSGMVEPVYKYLNSGTYTSSLQVRIKQYPKFVFGFSKQINILPLPKTEFTVINACEGLPVQFLNQTTVKGGNPALIKYAWNFGDNSTISTALSPQHAYNESGSFKVTLTSSLNGCIASITKNANQFAKPVARFTFTGACNLEPIKFNNQSTIAQGKSGYKWFFDDGAYSTLNDPLHQFTDAGTQHIKLIAISEFGCTDSIEQTIVLKESPLASFETSDPCNLSYTRFYNHSYLPAGTSNEFFWNFSGEGSADEEEPTFLFKSLGYKDVFLKITSSNGCSHATVRSFVVKRQARASFEVNDVCEGELVSFTNKSTIDYGNMQFEWRFGDNTISNQTSPKKSFTIAGTSKTYLVTLVAKVDDGCSDSIAKPVTINARTDARFNSAISGRLVQFDPFIKDNSLSYNWRFGEGTRSTEVNPLHSYDNIDVASFEVCLGIINQANCLSEWCDTIGIDLVSIKPNNHYPISIYPNPVSSSIFISNDGNEQFVSFKITDYTGKLICEDNLEGWNSTLKIEPPKLSHGTYFLQLFSNNGRQIITPFLYTSLKK